MKKASAAPPAANAKSLKGGSTVHHPSHYGERVVTSRYAVRRLSK